MNQKNRDDLIKFRQDRKWEEYHTELALVHAIGVEFGELSRLFQWGMKPSRERVGEEIADMLIYLEYLAVKFDLNSEIIVEEKIEKNREKYFLGVDHAKRKGWNKP
ncbi:MAG: nucleotide pyrophosphohydrolase [Candidatus Omnitrophica bacterium]|nr:nucleotide pyrophosphohydrolase [Candidatus Omnitrophota bacterium]